MRRVALVLALVATGAALSLYSRVAWPWSLLGWVMLVPWLAALDRLGSLGAVVALSAAMASVFCVAVFPWFPTMVADYSSASTTAATLAFLLAAPMLEPQLLIFAVARHLARRAAPQRWLATAAIAAGFYVGAEWALPKVMGDTIGHGQLPARWVRQSADLFGAHGITFALLIANEAVLAAARRALDRDAARWRRLAPPLLVLAGTACGLALYGALRIESLTVGTPAPSIRVAAVQADISHYDRLREEIGSFAAVGLILDTHFALSASVEGADLLLWPETVYPTTFGSPKSEEGAGFDRAIAAFVQQQRVPLLFGTYDAEDGAEFNAAVLIEPTERGVEYDVYRKTRLFPLTEHVPAPLDGAWLRRALPWAGAWTPGDGARTFAATAPDGREVTVAPLICYDAVDPALAIDAVRGGAEILLTLSNDSWFDYPGGRELILAVSTFRSIETRRAQVRATPTGLSAAVDRLGDTVSSIEPNRRGVLVASVQPSTASSVFVRFGNWLPPVALAIAVPALLWLRRGGRSGMRHSA